MLAEHEVGKLAGEAPQAGLDPSVGDAMIDVVRRCRLAYGRVNSKAFNEKALSGAGEDADPALIAVMLSLTTAPIDSADKAMAAFAASEGVEQTERVMRFSSEIRKLHNDLRDHFTKLAKRSGLA